MRARGTRLAFSNIHATLARIMTVENSFAILMKLSNVMKIAWYVVLRGHGIA